jgi:hypothetical protein
MNVPILRCWALSTFLSCSLLVPDICLSNAAYRSCSSGLRMAGGTYNRIRCAGGSRRFLRSVCHAPRFISFCFKSARLASEPDDQSCVLEEPGQFRTLHAASSVIGRRRRLLCSLFTLDRRFCCSRSFRVCGRTGRTILRVLHCGTNNRLEAHRV